MTVIPNRIKIGWKQYDVVFADSRLNSGAELYGQINYDNCTITLRESSSPDQLRATLIHEVLHAIAEMYGLPLEEKFVTDLANALYTAIKDNFVEVKADEIAKEDKLEAEGLSLP